MYPTEYTRPRRRPDTMRGRPYEAPLTEPEAPKNTVRYIIQDLTDPTNPTVTECVGVSADFVGGNMLQFSHADGTVMVVAMKDGWCVTTEPVED